MKQLPRSFFARDTVAVARDLIGKIMIVDRIKVRLIETEAYARDEASHAFKKTERSAILFAAPGQVYVYLIYGMYHCLNFTAHPNGTDNDAGAVLIRAVEPLSHFRKLQLNRETDKLLSLCSGPGKLCQALEINFRHNGLKLGREIKLYDDGFSSEIAISSKIGITKAKELPWRFFVKESKFVSKGLHPINDLRD